MEIQWPLVFFSLLAGAGGGVLAFIGVSEVRGIAEKTRMPAVITALVLLILGGCASVLHLGQPSNIMAAATNIFSFSGISVELIMLGINVVVCIVYLVVVRRENPGSAAKIVGVIGLVTGLIMAFVVGNGYVIEAQPNWNNFMLPLSYFGSGLACGATIFASLMVARKENEVELKKISIFVIVAIAIQMVAFLGFGAVTGFAADALVYWVCAILIGSVVALVCAFYMTKNGSFAYAACVCALIAGIAFRVVMWMLGTGYLNLFADAAARISL